MALYLFPSIGRYDLQCSNGVLMGRGLVAKEYQEWIAERL
jgi:hypothetical protein